MKNNFNADKVRFMTGQIRNFSDEMIDLYNILDNIVQYNLILSDEELSSLVQMFQDIDILNGSLKHFNIYLQKYNNILRKKLEED